MELRIQDNSIHKPSRIKSTPAPICIWFAGTNLLTADPKTTANKELNTRAPADPKNTDSRVLLSAAKAKVAS